MGLAGANGLNVSLVARFETVMSLNLIERNATFIKQPVRVSPMKPWQSEDGVLRQLSARFGAIALGALARKTRLRRRVLLQQVP